MGISIAAILILGVAVVFAIFAGSKEDEPKEAIAEQNSKQKADESSSDQGDDNTSDNTVKTRPSQSPTVNTSEGASSKVEGNGQENDVGVRSLQQQAPALIHSRILSLNENCQS